MPDDHPPSDPGASGLSEDALQVDALRDVLSAIRRHRADEQPVFEIIVDHAQRLCDAEIAALILAAPGDPYQRLMVGRGIAPATRTLFDSGQMAVDGTLSYAARCILEGRVIAFDDMKQSDLYKAGSPIVRSMVDESRIRSVLFVPLMREDGAIGLITLLRAADQIRPFTDRQIALVEGFAAQAVIAIENVQQFREVQTRLERERASAEVLEVISRSRDDEAPVFEAILKRASQLCRTSYAGLALINEERTHLVYTASHGAPLAHSQIGDMTWDLSGQTSFAEAVRQGRPVQVADMRESALYKAGDPQRVAHVDQDGIRTFMAVPMFRNGEVIGAFGLARFEVSPFHQDDIDLMETFAAQAVIAIENVRQFREIQTRLVREQNSADVLHLISQSRNDEQPVFEAIVEKAAMVCRADQAALVLINDTRSHIRLTAEWGHEENAFLIGTQWPIDQPLSVTTSLRTGETVRITDYTETELYKSRDPVAVRMVEVEGIRSRLIVPLLKGDEVLGIITLSRRIVEPFSDADTKFVETFATQAVIAIENVRQFREVQERLAREEASREILDMISRTLDDEAPVFEVVLRRAATLCGSPMASLNIIADDRKTARVEAHWGEELRLIEVGKTVWSLDVESGPEFPTETAMREAVVMQCPDLKDTARYRAGDDGRRAMVDVEGIRTFLAVPLLRNGQAIGNIALYRRDVQPFTDDQISLVETFAAQAVIAIENVRQFREVQERLEREKASGEVLEIISTSREDDLPVFGKITQAVSRLCNAPLAYICVLNEARTHVSIPAQTGATPQFAERLNRFREPVENDWLMAVKAVLDREVIRIDDLADDPLYRAGNEYRVNMVDEEGMRSVLVVPLVSHAEGVGCIFLYRREVAPFSDAEVELVRSFAAQAVIAIENVRQFREVQERLEREEASAEILGVISQSRDDEGPVFQAIVDNAARLLDARDAGLTLANEAGTHCRLVATIGLNDDTYEIGSEFDLSTPLQTATAIREGRVINIADISDDPLYYEARLPDRVRIVEIDGIRSRLSVPLLSGDTVLGCINLARAEVRPFTDSEVALIQTFAAQAVIAIENVRQFREVQTRLQRERASAEILGVISTNRDDEAPVFESILSNAARLCRAPMAWLLLLDESQTGLYLAAYHGSPRRALDIGQIWRLDEIDEQSGLALAIAHAKTCQDKDLSLSPGYLAGQAGMRQLVDEEGMRTRVSVPLHLDDRCIGAIVLNRREVTPFGEDEIRLVDTFARQAVIAIENVRQFKALETLNAELGDRVEEQVGEIERMGKLKRFLPAAVADTVVSSGSEDMLKSHRALLGVLFCDIRGFTAFCETAEPEETIEVLQTYHEEMGKLINAHGAGVDHRMGDGIMVLFNDPVPCDDPAGDAVRLALAMQARMEELCKGWKRLGHRLGFGVGVSLGYATVGMVGYEGRSDYTASGTAVNLAARLCDQAEDREILLSARAAIAVEDDHPVEAAGELSLKGIREPVEVFRLTPIT